MDPVKLIVIDLETTGLYPEKGDTIIEIGAVPIQNDTVLMEERFETFVDPNIPIPPHITRITGITDDMVRGAPPLDESLIRFLSYIGDCPLVAHNAPFDIGFLEAAARKMGEEYTPPVAVDTCELARKVFPGLPSYSLQNLAARFKIESPAAHRAVDDARICLRLFEIECESLRGKDLTAADLAAMTKK